MAGWPQLCSALLLLCCSSTSTVSAAKLYDKGDWDSLWWLPAACEPAPGKQCAVDGSVEGAGAAKLPHLMFLPPGDPPPGGWPVIIFLHGQGESSGASPLTRVALQGPPQHAGRSPDTMSFAVLSPQKPIFAQFFDGEVADAIMATLDGYLERFQLDTSRIYLTGVSQGGIGTWGLGSDPKYAHRFAAIAPVCGGLPDSPGRRAATLADTPVWAFHGANDSILPVSMSDEAIAALNKHERTAYAGAVKYTRIDEAPGSDYAWGAAGVPEMEGHASWVHAYYPPGYRIGDVPPLYEWFGAFARRSAASGSLQPARGHAARHPKV